MADEIQLQATAAWDVYALIRDPVGDIWNGSSFETYVTANLGTYDIPMSEQGTASGFYEAAFPTSIGAAIHGAPYGVSVYRRIGGSPSEGDPIIGSGNIEWESAIGKMYQAVTFGAVDDVGPSSTVFETDLTEVSDDHYGNSTTQAVCAFRSGVLKGQSRPITGYAGSTKEITVTPAFTEAPADTDEFVILGLVA